ASVTDFKIKWIRPKEISSLDPRQTGDLGIDIPVKPTDIKLYYQNSKELEDASDIVRNMFTVAFQTKKEARNLEREGTINLVKRHICDRGSSEVKIAAMTNEIQFLQKYMSDNPRNKKTKVFLKELIDKRNKYLKLMRKWDYRRFEWLLERLNLIYLPQPKNAVKVSRKDSLRKLTNEYCSNVIKQKLNEYRDELRKEQELFYAEKAEKLALILKQEKEYGLTPSVTENDIKDALKKVEELSRKNV
ncbi:28S ribosomal protein S15, mitochondrial, partial [Eufriesea mexicana]